MEKNQSFQQLLLKQLDIHLQKKKKKKKKKQSFYFHHKPNYRTKKLQNSKEITHENPGDSQYGDVFLLDTTPKIGLMQEIIDKLS